MTLPSVVARRIGRESEPVAIIDNFASDPEALRRVGSAAAFSSSDDHYPGLKAAVPGDYLTAQRGVLSTVFREVFGVSGEVLVLEVSFAVVSTQPDALTLQQRIPHVDGLQPGRLALVHYLQPGGCDGTAFYRHRRTGFETIDLARSAKYFAALEEDVRQNGTPPPAYPDGDTPVFERIGQIEGAYNRALLYRGRMLHSGAISPGHNHTADPTTGRLTITGFFAAGQRGRGARTPR